MIVGLQSSNSQVFCSGFLSKSLLTISWGNVDLYIVGKEMRKTHFKKFQVESFTGHS